MEAIIIFSAVGSKAFFPLIPIIFKVASAIGVKKHGAGKLISKAGKELAKDQVKDAVQKKKDDKKKEKE